MSWAQAHPTPPARPLSALIAHALLCIPFHNYIFIESKLSFVVRLVPLDVNVLVIVYNFALPPDRNAWMECASTNTRGVCMSTTHTKLGERLVLHISHQHVNCGFKIQARSSWEWCDGGVSSPLSDSATSAVGVHGGALVFGNGLGTENVP